LGHAYRKLNDFEKAKYYFNQASEDLDSQESAQGGLALIAFKEQNYFAATDLLHQILAKNPENTHCAALLDSILSNLQDKGGFFPSFEEEYLDPNMLNSKVKTKFSNEECDIILPDYCSSAVDEFEFKTKGEPIKSTGSDMLTLGKLKGRVSFASDYSPDMFSNKKGFLSFEMSSPPPEGTQTPPRARRNLFFDRESDDKSPDESEGLQYSFSQKIQVESNIFQANSEDEYANDDDMVLEDESDSET
jgi:tetratricopeptide (TPR) repeat protein